MKQLNPYRKALGLLFRRLIWDIDPRAWLARRKLRRFRNIHAGEKCIICCNGPSLLDTDFNSIDGVKTIGLNKINLLYNKTSFRCDYVVAVNPFVIEQNYLYFSSCSEIIFLDAICARRNRLLNRQNILGIHTGVEGFAEDCSFSVSQGYTVTYVALQLAFHMGFEKVALIGCDHSFIYSGGPNETNFFTGSDQNHFDPEYFKNSFWQNPDLNGSERSYLHALASYSSANRLLVNCSARSELTILPRMALIDFLNC